MNGELEFKDPKLSDFRKQPEFLEYPLNITVISNLSDHDSLEQFYTLVNKSGYRLNPNELNKAQFHDSIFLELVERIADSQELKELDIFTDATKKRMNDRALIEEIVASMISGVFDKRYVVNTLFKTDITSDDSEKLYASFCEILNKLLKLNATWKINSTRYCQRNDFLTLFHFIFQNQKDPDSLLLYQYRILLLIEKHIRPTQEKCMPLKEYALNCVSQTNSKHSREGRIEFFNMILKNTDPKGNLQLNLVLEYLEDFWGIDVPTRLIPINSYFLIDIEKISR